MEMNLIKTKVTKGGNTVLYYQCSECEDIFSICEGEEIPSCWDCKMIARAESKACYEETQIHGTPF